MPKFSIVIPVCNKPELTDACLASIRANSSDYEIIIVDNGSYPAFIGDVKIIRNDSNKGFPVAVNQGIKAATGEIIIILNNDTLVTPDWLNKFNAHLQDYDLVGPVTNFASGPQQISVPDNFSPDNIDDFSKFLAGEKGGAIYPWHRLVFFCVAIKKSVFDKIGLLDEQFSPGNFEDDDFCMRAIEAGFRLGIADNLFIYHLGSATHKEQISDYKKLLETNLEKFQKKWPEWKYKLMQKKVFYNCAGSNYKKKHSLALVMIVKNEEKGLERAILSCIDLVDEIVISIDTATTDKTEEIARRYTDNIKHHHWQDNFAAARNYAHEGVKSDWILFLDGHEYVDQFKNLDQHLDLECDGLLCTIEMENGAQFRNPRIYKNGVQFDGFVHELQKFTKVLPYTEFVVKHDRVGGQDLPSSIMRNIQRDDQVLRIMGNQLKRDPKNLRAAFHLGLYFEGRGFYKNAIKYFNRYLKYSKNSSERWYVFFNRALCQLALNHCFRAFWSASMADDETPGRWEIFKLKGLIFYQRGKFYKAIEQFIESFKINTTDQTYRPWKRDDVATWNLIGESFFNIREYFKAHISFKKAAEKTKDDQFKDILQKRADLMLTMSQKIVS